MTRTDNVLRNVAFGWLAFVGLVGGLFVIGETFDDPGGWAAAGLVALWLVPFAALAVLALVSVDRAEPVFLVCTLAVALFTIADSVFGVVPRDSWGPVAAIVVFILGVAVAFLGLHRATLGGALLLILAGAQLVAALAEGIGEEGRGAGPGSSTVVIAPLAIGGVLFLLAGRHSRTAPGRRRHRHAAAAR